MFRPIIAGAALMIALANPAMAEGDAKKGKRIFNKCKACHAVGEGAKNKVGPILNGIIDSPAGENAEFSYSDELLAKASEGLVWDEASLASFLTNPKDFLPGTKMAFAGLRKEKDIADVIAYLSTFE